MSEEKFYAGFWVRLFAGALDLVFLLPLFFILLYIFGVNEHEIIKISQENYRYTYLGASVHGRYVEIINYALSIFYIAYFLSSKNQATVGKKVMGIYVGNIDGSRLSGKKALLRAIVSMLTAATLGLGFLIVIFTKEKIALHDFICKTRVFHGRKK